jgi:hypothetical protein
MSLRTPTGSEFRRGNFVAVPRQRGGMELAHAPARRMPTMKPVGKPDAGNPHVRFDERGGETGCLGDTAPLLDSTVEILLCGRSITIERQKLRWTMTGRDVSIRPRSDLANRNYSWKISTSSMHGPDLSVSLSRTPDHIIPDSRNDGQPLAIDTGRCAIAVNIDDSEKSMRF